MQLIEEKSKITVKVKKRKYDMQFDGDMKMARMNTFMLELNSNID